MHITRLDVLDCSGSFNLNVFVPVDQILQLFSVGMDCIHITFESTTGVAVWKLIGDLEFRVIFLIAVGSK